MRWPAAYRFWLAATLLTGVGLRVLGMQGDFWFDEVWSARYSLAANSPIEVYRETLDNNHVLNSLAIYLVGPRGSVWPYRALAFFSGLIVLALGTACVRPRTPAPVCVGALLIGGSPLLVLLSSEARGYAPALAASLVGWWALRRALSVSDWRTTLLFNAVMPIGLLAHLVFLHFYLAAFTYAVYRLVSVGTDARSSLRRLLVLFGFPTLAAAAHAVLFVSRMKTGGGPEYAVGEFIQRLIAFTFGLPEWPIIVLVAALLAGLAFGLQLRTLRRSGDADWVFLLVVVLLSPLFFLGTFPTDVIAVRYFAIQILFLLITIAAPIARALQRSGWQRSIAGVAIGILVSSNAALHLEFARSGRGQYRSALETMAAQTPGGRPITVGGDHDSRVRLLVEFHRQFIGRNFQYVMQEEAASSPPGWFIVHDTRHPEQAANYRISVHGRLYRFVERFSFAYLSGFVWDLYRLEAQQSGSVG